MAVTLSNIAGVNNSRGKFQEALANMEKVLEIQLKCLGGSHASVAGTKMNIGLVYCELGNKTKQLQLDREAYSIYLQALGPDHPKTKEIAQYI